MVPLPLVIDTISRWSTLLHTVPALVLAQMEGGREVTIPGEQTSFQSTSGWLPEPSRAHYPPRLSNPTCDLHFERTDLRGPHAGKTRMNDLDWVLNGEGTNGIYNSSEAERYGGYNYCNVSWPPLLSNLLTSVVRLTLAGLLHRCHTLGRVNTYIRDQTSRWNMRK